MQVRSLLYSLLGLQTILTTGGADAKTMAHLPQPPGIDPKNIISQSEINAILSSVNRARRTVNPAPINAKEISWNASLAYQLNEFVIKNGGEIFFQTDTQFPLTIPNTKYNWIGLNLMKHPEFAQYTDQCFFWVHDTNDNGPMKVSQIFDFRIKQSGCFEYSNCSSTENTDFATCAKNPASLLNGGSCSYFDKFYMQLILPDIESVACVSLGVPGPFTPNNQPNSFWCYACTKKPMIYSNDIPYVTGARASACAETDYPIASNGLCTPAPTSEATIAPTKSKNKLRALAS